MSLLNNSAREIATNQMRAAEGRIQRLNDDEGMWHGEPGVQAEIRRSMGEAISTRNQMADFLRKDQDALQQQRESWVNDMAASGKLGKL